MMEECLKKVLVKEDGLIGSEMDKRGVLGDEWCDEEGEGSESGSGV
jgi:hypothetical protein